MSDTSEPLAGLPGADRTLLARPPLELAIAEVRLSPHVGKIDDETGLALREGLATRGWVFPTFDVVREERVTVSMALGAPTQQVSTVASGWQMVSADGATQVTLMPSSLVLQTRAYERWSVSLRPLLEATLEAVAQALRPALHQRIGLRYVNRFVDASATSPASWTERINPNLLGAACHPVLGQHVRAAQQQLEMVLEEAAGALLRHGPFVDAGVGNATSYLLDIDVFDAKTGSFDTSAIVERAEELNRTAAVLFQAAITPEFLRELQGPAEQPPPTETEALG